MRGCDQQVAHELAPGDQWVLSPSPSVGEHPAHRSHREAISKDAALRD